MNRMPDIATFAGRLFNHEQEEAMKRNGQIMKHQHPQYEDPVVSYMKQHNIPVTRERYIARG
jgi:hypothetical protein